MRLTPIRIRKGDTVFYKDFDSTTLESGVVTGHTWKNGERVVCLDHTHWIYRSRVEKVSSIKQATPKSDTLKTKHVQTITVIDPDTKAPVEVEIRKIEASGAMIGIDGSFLEQDVGEVYNPYNKNGWRLEIPDDET